jgi:hypothetical protein
VVEEDELDLPTLYDRVCDSYHYIDDFRMKLLGLLPIATGSGVFLLLSSNKNSIGAADDNLKRSLGAIGVFGMLFTVGLFAYELYGIKRCHYLIETGRLIERQSGQRGQFRSRPKEIAMWVNEPFASAFIYPASLAAWAFLATAFWKPVIGVVLALVLFVVGFFGTLLGARRIGPTYRDEERVLRAVAKAKAKDQTVQVQELVVPDFEGPSVEGAVKRLVSQGELSCKNGILELPKTARE